MSTRLIIAFACAVLLAALGAPVYAQDDATGEGMSISDFSIVWQRNVFDPDRSPFRPRRIEDGSREQGPPPVRMERFALTGAMVQDGHTFAFFEGSDSEYNRVAKPGDSLGGVLLTALRTDGATLEVGGETIHLPVGMQLSRHGDGPWRVGEREGMPEPERTVRSDQGGESGGGGSDSDALQKMLERRRKEMGG